jgi:homoaconitase/3-isopropylmalate dehydratase large subunit
MPNITPDSKEIMLEAMQSGVLQILIEAGGMVDKSESLEQ